MAKRKSRLDRAIEYAQSEVARNMSLRPSAAASARELEASIAQEGSTLL